MNIIEATKTAQEKKMAMRRPHWDTDLWDGEKYYPKCFYPTNGYGSTLQKETCINQLHFLHPLSKGKHSRKEIE